MRGWGSGREDILHKRLSMATTSYGMANYGTLETRGCPPTAMRSIVRVLEGNGAFACMVERDGDSGRHVAWCY